jgi:tetratricopeptide (TPR) repeat protein
MKRFLPWLILVVGLAAATTFVAQSVDRGPFQRAVSGAELGPWTAALRLQEGSLPESALESLPSPLYPRLLVPLASEEIGTVRRARSLLTVIQLPLLGLLVALLARRRAGSIPAVAAGLGAMLCAPFALHAGALSPALPAALLGLLALFVVDGRESGGAPWLVGGLLAGGVGWFEPALGWALLPLLAGAAVLRREAPRRGLAALLLVVGWAVGAGGVGFLTGGGIPSVSGPEAYRGHAAEAPGVSPRRGGTGDLRWWTGPDFVRDAQRRADRRLTLGEADGFWRKEASRAPLRDPAATLRRGGIKLLASYQADPLAKDVGAAFLRDRADRSGLTVTTWIARFLIPLGLAGLVIARRRVGAVIIAGALSPLLAAILSYAQPETRLLGLACVAASGAILAAEFWSRPGGFRLRALIAAVAAVAIFGWLVPLQVTPGRGITGEDLFQLGSLYDRELRGSAALREYERALRLEPDNPSPRFAIAGMLARDNVLDEAIRELETLRSEHPDFYPGLVALSRLYQQMQRYPEAASVYGDIIRLDPYNPEPRNNLGTLYVTIGYYDQAVRALESALAVDPDYTTARTNLEMLRDQGLTGGSARMTAETVDQAQEVLIGFIRGGRFAEADSVLAGFYDRFGTERAGLRYAEGILRISEGDPVRAAALFESVRDSLGGNILFLNNLAAAYARSGRLCEALAVWADVLTRQPNNERVRRSMTAAQAEADSLGLDCPE